jgi:predicted N-acetyltransferase YhbS
VSYARLRTIWVGRVVWHVLVGDVTWCSRRLDMNEVIVSERIGGRLCRQCVSAARRMDAGGRLPVGLVDCARDDAATRRALEGLRR